MGVGGLGSTNHRYDQGYKLTLLQHHLFETNGILLVLKETL